MTERVIGPTGSPRRRWTLLLPLVAVFAFGLFYIAGAQAVHDDNLFELDKNATNDLNTTKIAVLQANISATDSPIVICETAPPPLGTPAATPFSILVEAEQMTVTARDPITGGAGGCSTKASYTVTRVGGVAHQKADDVTLLVTATKDGPDWNQVYAAVQADANTKCLSLGLVECSYANDGAGQTIFDQGGSKDHEVIANWKHKSGSVSGKSDILNAYAAKDIDPDDHQILYFGADRLAVDGSTDAGFWFFKNPVVACPNPSAGTACNGVPDGTFTGQHSGSFLTPGDILILTTFTQGGATNTVRVFRWVGSGGNESGSIQGPDATFADCVPGGANDNGCATVNDTSITVPWDYTAKGEPVSGWVPAGGLLEGGVDLTALGLQGCFSSFLAETRSSPSVPAILEDFVLGSFEACGSGLTSTPNGIGTALGADTNSNNLVEASIGTGSVQVTDSAVLNVTGTTSFTGTLSFSLCGPIDAPATCNTGGTSIAAASGVNPVTANGTYSSAAATVTSVGRYCWRATFTSGTTGVPSASDSTGESASGTGECFEVLPVTPSLSTEATSTPVAPGSPISDKAFLSGTANQPGSPVINPTTAGAAANGTIVFKAYGPTATSTASCIDSGIGANLAFTSSAVTVSGDKTSPSFYASGDFSPSAPGYYHWVATYSGDSPNTSGPVATSCGDANETSQVLQLQPTIGTAQNFVPNDSATITVASGAGNLAGSVVFKMWVDDDQCSGGPDHETATPIDITSGTGTGLSRTVTSNNTTPYSATGTTFHWVVEYTSTNAGHKNVTSPCGVEHSSITIENAGTPNP